MALGGAPEARACKPFVAEPAAILGPVIEGAAVEVTRTAIDVRCDDEAEGGRYHHGILRCRTRATYRLEHGGVTPAVARGEVVARRGVDLRVRRGDREIGRPAPERALEEGDQARQSDGRDPPAIQVFELPLAVGERVELTVDAELEVEMWMNVCDRPSIFRRHARWGGPIYGGLVFGLPDRQTSEVAVDLDLPRRYGVDDDLLRLDVRRLRRVRGAPGRRHLRGRIGPRRYHALEVTRDLRQIYRGPFVAAGIDLGSGHPRPRLRVGYELAAPVRWWIHALAVESDLKALTIVPSTEVASASAYWIPSAGLGVGVPVRVYPEARAGFRAQLTVHWAGRVAAIGTFDVYPVKAGRDELRGGVMLQLGL
ncbi:MAG: hypothetical protein R3B09_02085 [Nannocystaceae bacterium]